MIHEKIQQSDVIGVLEAEYADELVLCWNEHDKLKAKADCHDELVTALTGLVDFWAAEDYGPEQQGLMAMARDAIAKAEKS